MLNIEKYKDGIKKSFSSNSWTFKHVVADIATKSNVDIELDSMDEVLDWLCEEYKEPILEDFEITLIKSFLDIVTFETVYKRGDELDLENEVGTIATIKMEGMFEKLEDHKKYTLEELGIWQ